MRSIVTSVQRHRKDLTIACVFRSGSSLHAPSEIFANIFRRMRLDPARNTRRTGQVFSAALY